MRQLHWLTAVAAAALLAACGDNEPDRGALRSTPAVQAALSAAVIDAGTTSSGLIALSGAARCNVRVVPLDYTTVGVRGEATNSSGVLLLPEGSATGCSGPFPLLAYARGTDVLKTRTLADPTDDETAVLTAMYAAQGYAVVATDYLGYAKSEYSFHPYLHADSQATTVIDSIRAARRAASVLGTPLSGKVMLSGYSQGGHASMAAHRAIEKDYANEINVVGGAHLAGPYNLSGFTRLPTAIVNYQFFAPFAVTAWQKVYGNVYSDVNTVFKAPYASYIESLLPSPTLTFTTLLTTGKLPAGSPSDVRAALFQPAYLADQLVNDNNGVYVAAKKNDLLGWTPKAPVMLCGGAGDPTVPPAVHQAPMKADFASRGVAVTSVDVDPQIQALYGVNGKAPTDPTSAAFATYYASYHGTYEPPLCAASARQFLNALK